MTFTKWLDTFITEKGITGDETLEIEGPSGLNIMPAQIVIDAVKSTSGNEQRMIKKTLVMIDFRSSGPKPVLEYFTHIGQAIAL